MDTLDFLDGQSPEPVAAPEPQAPEPVAAAPAAPPVTDGPARSPDGKLAPKAPTDAAPAAQAEAQAPAPAIPPVAEPAPVDPVVAELQKQVAGLTKALTATRQERRAPVEAPDPYEDFEAYQQFQQARENSLRADYSFKLFAATNGEEKARTVQEWAFNRAESDPVFSQRAIQSDDPFSFAAEEYEQHQTLQMLRDPTLREKFQAFMSGQGPAPPAAVSVAAPPQPPTPPRSLASAPNAGGAKPGAQPVGPGVAFDTTFKE